MENRHNNKHSNHYTKGGDKKEAIMYKPLEVKVYDNNFDRAFRTFRSLVQKEKILSYYKEKQEYEKPSDRKRRKINEAKRKRFELEREAEKLEKHSSKQSKE